MTNAEHGYEYTNKETGQKVKADTRQPHLENARWTSRVLTPEDNSRDERIAELEKLNEDHEEHIRFLERTIEDLRAGVDNSSDGDTGAAAGDKPAAAPKTPAKTPAKAKASDGNSADAS